MKLERKPQKLFDADASMAFFDGCGVKMKSGIIPSSLEEEVFERTIDLILETEERGSTRSSNVQKFCEPYGVDNRELYLVSTSSCRQIKRQKGSPFMDGSIANQYVMVFAKRQISSTVACFQRESRVIERVFEGKVGAKSTYIDFGSGIGNTCFQVACMYGCNAIGVENDRGRASSATVLKKGFEDVWQTHKNRDDATFPVGEVKLVCFDIRSPVHRENLIKDADFILCNNFNEMWTPIRGGDNIDGAVGGLFALMKPGATLATMTPLRSNLPILSLEEAKRIRTERNLPIHENSSFYEYARFNIRPQQEVCSWPEGGGSEKPVHVHRYVRTAQPAVTSNHQIPVFLCNNRDCGAAKECIPIEAVAFDNLGVPLVNDICPMCKQKVALGSNRRAK